VFFIRALQSRSFPDSACWVFINCGLNTPDDYAELWFVKAAAELCSNTGSPHSSAWRDRLRLEESPLLRIIDMHAAAVLPKQVQLGTHRGALRMWVPEDDSECVVWHFLVLLLS
jgi:hypothetical protein